MAVGREEEIAEAAAWGRRRPPPPPPLPARAAAAAARGMRREGVARRRAWAPSRRLAEETTEGRAILLRVCLLFKSSFYLYSLRIGFTSRSGVGCIFRFSIGPYILDEDTPPLDSRAH